MFDRRTSPRRPLLATLALAGALSVLGAASPVGAVDNPDYTVPPPPSTTVVTDTTVPDEPVPARQVTTAVQVERARTTLAITGSDLNLAAAVGAASVAVGAGVLVARRRRFESA